MTITVAEILKGIVTDDGFGNLAIRTVPSAESKPPSNILLSDNMVDSGSLAGTRVGALTVIDPNAEDTHTLTIVNDPDNKFSIENSTTSPSTMSYLTLKNPVDFLTKEFHEVRVRATDPTNLSVEVVFTIQVISLFNNATSLDFNGLDEYATGGDIHNYDIADAFSVSMWVNPDNIANAMILFSKATIDANVNGYMLRVNATTGQLFLQMRSGSNANHTFDTAVLANEWQLIVFTYSGAINISGASVYRNAVKNVTVPSGGLSGTMLYGQPFYLGQRSNSFGFFNGKQDEVSVWDKELTQAEIDEIYNEGIPSDLTLHSAHANLKSWYRFDNDTIPTVIDYIGADDLATVNMDSSNLSTDVP